MKCLRHLKKEKKKTEEMLPYWSSLVRMAGSCEKRERERKYALDIYSKRRKIYIKEKRRRVRTYSSYYCLDIGALIFTTMFQLPSCYLHDMLTSIVSF